MPLQGPVAVTPNIASSNTRRIDVENTTVVAGGTLVLGPLDIAAQGTVGFALSVAQPHPALRIVVISSAPGASPSLDLFILPASFGTAATVVSQVYRTAARQVTVQVQDYLVGGPFDASGAIYSMTA